MLHPIHLHLQQVVVQHYIHYKTTSTTKLHLHHGACSRMWWCKQRGPRLHPRKQGLFSYSVKPWKYWKKNCSFSLFPEHSSNGMKLNWVNRSRETCFQDKLLFLTLGSQFKQVLNNMGEKSDVNDGWGCFAHWLVDCSRPKVKALWKHRNR